jgi:hypothetical protein
MSAIEAKQRKGTGMEGLLAARATRRGALLQAAAWMAAAALAQAMAQASSAPLQQTAEQDEAKARRWRVMVIVQEQHLARPRIPDPAVETALTRALIDAGYKVIDRDRVRELRYTEVVDRIVKGGPGALKEAQKLGRRFGADVLITGEAFSQEDGQPQVIETDLGRVTRLRCRARVELKGVRMDTAEMVFADAIHKTGSPEASVELASKRCLEQAADELGPAMLKKLDRLAFSPSQHVELQVRGVPSIAVSRAIEGALQKLPGVLDVSEGDYEARVYRTELRVDRSALRDVAARLETHPGLKRFRLKVESANGSRIVAVAQPEPPKPGKR